MDATTLIVIVAVAFLLVRAGRRGRNAVTGYYRRRVAAWKRSRPAPTPVGVKVGAGAATALVGAVLFTRGFVAGLREGWPDGKKAAQDWYAKHLADRPLKARPADTNRCPTCRRDLARAGWPQQHTNRHGEPCPYDWSTDPVWRRCPDCQGILPPGGDTCPHCIDGQPASPVQCAHHDDCDGQCPKPADLAGKSIYCTDHTKNDAGGKPAAAQPRLRLVHNADPTAGGTPVAVDTATGGDVHTVEQANAELDAIEREQTAEREDAQLELARARKDETDHAQLLRWLDSEDFPAELRAVAGQIRDRIAGRIAAAQKRVAAADQLLSDVANAKRLLDPHTTIRDTRAAAGGMARRTAYVN